MTKSLEEGDIVTVTKQCPRWAGYTGIITSVAHDAFYRIEITHNAYGQPPAKHEPTEIGPLIKSELKQETTS